jgi:hypothetical protein
MSIDRAATSSESVLTPWNESDELFFALVGDALSTSFLRGATALLASYDAEDADDAPDTTASRHRRSSPSLPIQRSLAA